MPSHTLLSFSVLLAIGGFLAGRALSSQSAALLQVSPLNPSPAASAYSHVRREETLAVGESQEIIISETDSEAVTSEAGKRLLSRWIKIPSVANATPDDLEALIRNTNGNSKDQAKDFAFRRLAELDPKRAADLWAENRDYKGGFEAVTTSQNLAGWAEKDPEAFAQWTLGQRPEVQQRSRYALESFGRNSPERFAAIAPVLAETPAAKYAAGAAIDGMKMKDKNSGETALAYAQSLPAGPCRDGALVAMLTWPDARPEEKPEILATLSRMDPDEARRLGDKLGKIVGALPAGAARESAFTAALRDEAGRDAAAAAKRLEGLSGSPDYAAAVRGFVEKTASKDPSAAAEWALTIPADSPQQRSSTLEKVASTWFKANPDAARAWVENASLSDAEYFQLTGRDRNR